MASSAQPTSQLEIVHNNNIIRLACAHLDLKQAMAACEVSGRVVAKEAAAARKAALADAKKRAAPKSGGKPKVVLADVKKRVASKAFFRECKQRWNLLLNCLNNLNNPMI